MPAEVRRIPGELAGFRRSEEIGAVGRGLFRTTVGRKPRYDALLFSSWNFSMR